MPFPVSITNTGRLIQAYFPSRSESPGTARSTESLTRCHASRVACFARSQSSVDVPRAESQSSERSDSTSSKLRPGYRD